jgi:hypothetical protein
MRFCLLSRTALEWLRSQAETRDQGEVNLDAGIRKLDGTDRGRAKLDRRRLHRETVGYREGERRLSG